MKTFLECFNIILTGDKDASRQAARQVRKLVYSSGEGDKFKLIASIIQSAPKEYEKITEDWRRENFVQAVSVMYFLGNREEQPDFLFPWFYHLVQHPSGNIRYAATRMYENELGPLTVHIRCPDEKSSFTRKLSSEQADIILFELFANLIDLTNDLWKPEYKKYKYIFSFPSSAYKSVQMVLSGLEGYCGKEYMVRLEDSYRKVQIIEDRKRIIEQVENGDVLIKTAFTLARSRLKQMREELEKNMLPMARELYPKFDFKNVVANVYEGGLHLAGLIELLDSTIDLSKHTVSQRNLFLDLVSTMWNIFPHKELGGYSPYEISAMHEIIEKS